MSLDITKTGGNPPATPKELCPILYRACIRNPEKMWSQEDLLGLNVIPENNVNLLAACLNDLCNQRRFINYHSATSNTLSWKVVKKEDVARYKGLSQEESVVLSHVDNSQQEGIWVRHIRSRSGLAQNNVNNALKKLEQKGIVKQITSAKNPARKHYMLAHLQPSEDVTGGPFFTDGALDEDYVFQISKVIYDYVARQSWEQRSSRYRRQSERHVTSLRPQALPMPPGYDGYPTLADITRYVNERGVSSIRLVDADVSQLLDLLCWDGRITKVGESRAYRSVKAAAEPFDEIFMTNGLTESPCGLCPVFEWCDDHGPVNSKTCIYLTEWLDNDQPEYQYNVNK